MVDEQPLPDQEPQADSHSTDDLQDDELDQIVGGAAPFIPGGAIISAAVSGDGATDG